MAFVADEPHSRERGGHTLQDSDAVVGRGIVEDDHLARPERLRENGVQRPRQVAGVVAVRHHDRQVRGGHGPHAACFCAARWAFIVLMLKYRGSASEFGTCAGLERRDQFADRVRHGVPRFPAEFAANLLARHVVRAQVVRRRCHDLHVVADLGLHQFRDLADLQVLPAGVVDLPVDPLGGPSERTARRGRSCPGCAGSAAAARRRRR